MKLSLGIVGLPNVGKSTLFNILTKQKVLAANYPFATIDPNVGVVPVPDERVDKLAKLSNSKKVVPAVVEFYDIAGLVKGANKGEGLGNKFLANIRETDAIIYVLRAFLEKDIVNTRQEVNPVAEKEILDTELILKDSETVEKRMHALSGDFRAGKKDAVKEYEVLEKVKGFLDQGKILIEQGFSEEEEKIIAQYQLLTAKPRFYLLNGRDEEVPQSIIEEFKKNNWQFLIVDVLTEFGATDLTREERISLGLPEESEMGLLIKKAYEILGLITFLTTGPDETRAWTLKKGSLAPQAGGAIHTDFESHFIKAEVINWQTLLDASGFIKAREKGLIRTEGKEYLVQDGDVIEIKHNA